MKNKISCIIVDDEQTAREILEGYLSKIDNVVVEGSCANANEAFGLINTKKVDVIFLDINMPGISGLSFARAITKNIKIIFTTAYREYAVEGFDLQAVDYLLKPISFERLLRALQAIREVSFSTENPVSKEIEQEENDFMFIRADRKMIKINFADISYLESASDYLKIYTGTTTIVARETISNIEKKLPASRFLRIHRSFIISLDKIDSYTNEHVEMVNQALPISRSYKSLVLAALEKWSVER